MQKDLSLGCAWSVLLPLQDLSCSCRIPSAGRAKALLWQARAHGEGRQGHPRRAGSAGKGTPRSQLTASLRCSPPCVDLLDAASAAHARCLLHACMESAVALCQLKRASRAQEFPWIPSEKQEFGRAGGEYDWAAQDPEEAIEQHRTCAQEQQHRAKGLNKRVRTSGSSFALNVVRQHTRICTESPEHRPWWHAWWHQCWLPVYGCRTCKPEGGACSRVLSHKRCS